jgi:Alginate export
LLTEHDSRQAGGTGSFIQSGIDRRKSGSEVEMSFEVTVRSAAIFAGVLVIAAGSARAQSASPSPSAQPATAPLFTAYVRDWTRVEMWNFFEPKPGGGDPSYAFIANRLQFGVERHTQRYDLLAAGQYVEIGGLPANAVGPGPLGTGPLYFDQGNGTSHSQSVYLRYLNVRLKDILPGWSVQAGRMAYTSGSESPSGDPKIEAVKRQRVDSKLLGEFEWSHYQRGYDGVRTDVDRPSWHATGAVFHPTQGGFENQANVDITDIAVYAGAFSTKPKALRHTDLTAFAIRYDDDRAVRARPDNSGKTATAVDVHISTFGGTAIWTYAPASSYQFDLLGWFAGQTGDWYGQEHRALAATGEGGVQWTSAPWKPWLRGGMTHASGDDDPNDGTHGTFFQVLPTVRKYSLSATYSVMNLNDTFVQLLASPRPQLSLRVDVHQLSLPSAADRWYFGSGATQQSGTVFGYAGRSSAGVTALGTVVEGSADYRFNRHFSINGYLGGIHGGDIVAQTFAGRQLVFGYLETVIQF